MIRALEATSISIRKLHSKGLFHRDQTLDNNWHFSLIKNPNSINVYLVTNSGLTDPLTVYLGFDVCVVNSRTVVQLRYYVDHCQVFEWLIVRRDLLVLSNFSHLFHD